MSADMKFIAAASLLTVIIGPLLFGILGLVRSFRAPKPQAAGDPLWEWRLTAVSAVLYALAFSLIFFIQEVFLVAPKALTPGLEPTLFHNNHTWEGDNPLGRLFQGTGALAILVTAIIFVFWLKSRPPRSATMTLFVVWMAFQGFFQSLPQVVLGSVFAFNDVGMALEYLEIPQPAKLAAAVLTLAVIPFLSLWFARALLALAGGVESVLTPSQRTRFIFQTATLPALAALPVIFLFRIPGTIDQVYIVPVAVAIIGGGWMQAGAWSVSPAPTGGYEKARPVVLAPLAALALLFLIFHLVLRPGVAF